MSTKEGFWRAVTWLVSSDSRNAEKVNDMVAYLEAKDAEIAELRYIIKEMSATGERDMQELAAVTKERDQWRHDAQKHSRMRTELVAARDELLLKIQSAPKIWFNLISGEYSAGEPFDLEECRACWTRVHAVPVSDHIVDANERDEGNDGELEKLYRDLCREQREKEAAIRKLKALEEKIESSERVWRKEFDGSFMTVPPIPGLERAYQECRVVPVSDVDANEKDEGHESKA